MYPVEYDVRKEQNKDLQRSAENERLVRQVRSQSNETPLTNARNVIGRGLVQIGHILLDER